MGDNKEQFTDPTTDRTLSLSQSHTEPAPARLAPFYGEHDVTWYGIAPSQLGSPVLALCEINSVLARTRTDREQKRTIWMKILYDEWFAG